MIIPMTKVQIVGPKEHLAETIKEIHRIGCLHIIDIRKEPIGAEQLATPVRVDPRVEMLRSRIEQSIARINGLISISLRDSVSRFEVMPETGRLYRTYCEKETEELVQIAEKLIFEVEQKPKKLAQEKEEKEKTLSLYSRYKTILSKVRPLVERIVKLEGFDTTAIIVDKKYASVVDILRDEMNRITGGRFEIISAEADRDTIAAIIVYPNQYSEPIHQLLWSENVTQVKLPEELEEYTYAEAIAIMEQKLRTLPAEIKELDEQIKTYAERYGPQLIAIRDALADRLQELLVLESLGETSFTFIISGWVPVKRLKKMTQALQKKFKGEVAVVEIPVTEEEKEEAPVVLENPRWAKPFELILGLFSLPKYGTIDPTPFLAIFYPLFFGIILGDVGYGLIILALAAFVGLRTLNKAVKAGAYMVGFSGFMAVVFGFLYDELFGFHFWEKIGLHPFKLAGIHLPFERAKEEFAIAYLVFALGLGAGHLLLGLILGIVNSIREKALKHLVEKAGFLTLFIAAFLIIGSTMKKLPPSLANIGWLAIFAAIAMIVWGGGLIGAIHIFSFVGHFFSYLRIMALGLAGVVLAVIANSFTKTFDNIVLGIGIAAVIHSLNIVLHTFSSTIHSIRLNILEFFDKFYESGGKPYKPFSMRR
jgi:V/A-type H+-transporting ATPase subunit I